MQLVIQAALKAASDKATIFIRLLVDADYRACQYGLIASW
jgi:hypothetical protein